MTFERTFDYALVRAIVRHPRVYRRALLSDFAPTRHQWLPEQDERFWYLVPRLAGRPLGVLIFEPRNPVCWEAHLAFLPEAWGDLATAACLGTVDWLAKHSPCRRITANVPEYNRLMHHLARRIGMHEIGVNEASISQGGRLHDQTIFGLTVKDSYRK